MSPSTFVDHVVQVKPLFSSSSRSVLPVSDNLMICRQCFPHESVARIPILVTRIATAVFSGIGLHVELPDFLLGAEALMKTG
jgi:hypothetical protein